ncbi:MAG: sulfite exporter TauE/SafE family protein [Gammaproteobacteria bacterium]|nr:sulfite exporter TauE/SafE family protein [Gammaproteobacteria bacterium]
MLMLENACVFEFTPTLFAVIGATFLAGGFVKGIIGIGLPLVVVPVVATYSNPLTAVGLMFAPAITSNIMQAYQAKLTLDTVQRFWPAMVAVMIGAAIGSSFLSRAEEGPATLVLSIVVILFCASQFVTNLPPIPKSREPMFTAVAGVASGTIGGLSGFFGLMLVPYLFALKLSKEDFVATIALLYLCGVIGLYVTMGISGGLTQQGVLVSVAATVPTLLGVWLGSLLRKHVSEALFRKTLILVLLLIAANLLRKSLS